MIEGGRLIFNIFWGGFSCKQLGMGVFVVLTFFFFFFFFFFLSDAPS